MTETPSAQDVERLASLLDDAEAARARTRLAGRVGALALLALIAGFLWSIYSMVTDRFRWERIDPPLRAEAERLTPVLQSHVRAAAAIILPAYERVARERLEETLPLLRGAMDAEWQVLEANMAARARPELEGAVRRIEDRQWARLKTRFPALASEEARQDFVDRWMHRVLEDHRALLLELERNVGDELVALADTTESFRPNRFDTWERERLTRHLVHLLLQRLDRHILSQDEPHSLDDASIPIGVTHGTEGGSDDR